MRSIFLISLFAMIACAASAQDSTMLARKWRFSPLPVVYYSPETRLGFGALVSATVNLGGNDPLTTTSYFQSSFIYTLNKQYEFSNTGRIYSPSNKRITQYRIYYAYFPEFFYGVRTQTPEAFKELIEFNRLWLEFRQYWRIGRAKYLGVYGRMNSISNLESATDGSLRTLQPHGHEGYTVTGFSPLFLIDSRNSQVYTQRGFYLEALWAAYPHSTSDFAYGNVQIDARWFRPLHLMIDDVVALQFFANLNKGSVPFRDMGDIGGSNTMRGYYRGYYRYENLYAFQAEYRLMFGRYIGMVGWLGGCLVSEKWYQPFEHSLKPNAGVGLG